MIRFIVLAATLASTVALAATPALAQKRSVDAHEHGASALNIAIEGTKVTIELEAPGNDIVGFEKEAKTDKQKAAVEAAKTKLAAPLELFVMPAAAGCTAAKPGAIEIKYGKAGHSEFEGKYELTCTAPDKIADLDLAFFKAFPKAERMTVTLISGKGQKQFKATPKKPTISLAGAV
jgi:hypothetical protein